MLRSFLRACRRFGTGAPRRAPTVAAPPSRPDPHDSGTQRPTATALLPPPPAEPAETPTLRTDPPGVSAGSTPLAPTLPVRIYAAPLSLLLCCVGLFTVSWDRLGNVVVAGFNVKLPVIALFASLAVSLLETPRSIAPPRVRVVYHLVLTLTVVYGGAVVFGIDRHAGLGQFFTVLLGAVLPMVAIERVARVHGRYMTALSAFIAGGVFASAFGLYQLAASYVGLPQFVQYTDTGGGVGRIAAFCYEPAYFGYFLILVLAAIGARDVLETRPRSPLSLLLVLTALALCNSRAVFFTIPLFLILCIGTGRVGIGRFRNPNAIVTLVLLFFFGLFLQPGAVTFAQSRLSSAFDKSETTSNAPRLEQYDVGLDIIREHPFGIGPGSLLAVGPSYGLEIPKDLPANRVVTNNIWLQSMLDGGILLTLAQLLLVVGVTATMFRRSLPDVRILVAGWLTIIVIGGMLTSFFYDIRMWATLGLALALVSAVEGRDATPLRARRF